MKKSEKIILTLFTIVLSLQLAGINNVMGWEIPIPPPSPTPLQFTYKQYDVVCDSKEPYVLRWKAKSGYPSGRSAQLQEEVFNGYWINNGPSVSWSNDVYINFNRVAANLDIGETRTFHYRLKLTDSSKTIYDYVDVTVEGRAKAIVLINAYDGYYVHTNGLYEGPEDFPQKFENRFNVDEIISINWITEFNLINRIKEAFEDYYVRALIIYSHGQENGDWVCEGTINNGPPMGGGNPFHITPDDISNMFAANNLDCNDCVIHSVSCNTMKLGTQSPMANAWINAGAVAYIGAMDIAESYDGIYYDHHTQDFWFSSTHGMAYGYSVSTATSWMSDNDPSTPWMYLGDGTFTMDEAV